MAAKLIAKFKYFDIHLQPFALKCLVKPKFCLTCDRVTDFFIFYMHRLSYISCCCLFSVYLYGNHFMQGMQIGLHIRMPKIALGSCMQKNALLERPIRVLINVAKMKKINKYT